MFYFKFEKSRKRSSGWGTWIPAKTRVADQKPLACSVFFSNRGGRLSALWTMFVDQRKAQVFAAATDVPMVSWWLPPGAGTKHVHARRRDRHLSPAIGLRP